MCVNAYEMPTKKSTSLLWDDSSPVLSSFLLANFAINVLDVNNIASARNVFTFLGLVRLGIDSNKKMFDAIPRLWSGSKQPHDVGVQCVALGLVAGNGRKWELTMLGKLRIMQLEYLRGA